MQAAMTQSPPAGGECVTHPHEQTRRRAHAWKRARGAYVNTREASTLLRFPQLRPGCFQDAFAASQRSGPAAFRPQHLGAAGTSSSQQPGKQGDKDKDKQDAEQPAKRQRGHARAGTVWTREDLRIQTSADEADVAVAHPRTGAGGSAAKHRPYGGSGEEEL